MKKVYEDRLPELIAKEGFATVKALAAATYMSESTVRRRAALTQATHRFFLCDSEKLGKQSTFFIADAKNLDEIITINKI